MRINISSYLRLNITFLYCEADLINILVTTKLHVQSIKSGEWLGVQSHVTFFDRHEMKLASPELAADDANKQTNNQRGTRWLS